MKINDKQKSTYLSKTLFMKGMQCHKALYLEKYHPELKDEMDADTKRRLAGGHEVGEYAMKLFPGGTEVPYEGLDYTEQLTMTQDEIKKKTQTVYEAAFSYDSIFVKLDILHHGAQGWEIYEVKASNENKEHYLDDLSLQFYVAINSGLPITKVHIVYLNKNYIRKGSIEPPKLFVIKDTTSEVKENQENIKKNIEEIKKMLLGGQPEIAIGVQCSKPHKCDFWSHCSKHLPENSVMDLCGSKKIKFELHNEGYYSMDSLPLERLEPRQRFQVEAYVNKKEIVDIAGIKSFLDSLSYPLCFFDFETFQQPIPPFDGTSPYQKIPFQYSLHKINRKGDHPEHFEFLVEPGDDPREEIAIRLLKEIPDNACVLAYHKSFETEIMNNLKSWFAQYVNKLDRIIANMKDLKDPFKKKYLYHWKMQGSASLKDILPAVVPSLTYTGMQISHGGEAQDAYFTMGELEDPEELKRLRTALLAYCKLDTLAMVEIFEQLTEHVH